MKITLNQSGRKIVLTTERAESSYGVPVAVIEWRAYGPDDMMPALEGDEFGWIYALECARTAVTVAAKEAELLDHELVRRFVA